MNRRRRSLPPVPPKAPSELRPLIAAMTEILETGEGVRGDPLDRKVTLRDILDSGIGRLKPGMRPGQDGNLDSGALPPAPDLSIPPAPSGFDAQGGFYGMINLSWTIPGQQYRNHAYTNIFRSEEDNFANAEVIGREAGGFYTDYVRDDAVDPDDPTKLKGYYYWITFTSVADIEGPPNSPNGTYAAPLADLGYVIELLTGQIDAGVLATALRQEIEKIPAIESNIERIGPIESAIERLGPIETAIDRIGPIEAELRGPESLDGTVANRIAQERAGRIEALDEERAERIQGLTFEAQARAQAIQDEVENRTTAIHQAVEQLEQEDNLLALQQNVIAAVFDANAASIYSMSQVRINDQEVFAQQIEQLFGSVDSNQALILNERQIRIDQLSSLSTQVGILSARLDARPSMASSFEPGSDFDAWTPTAGSQLLADTSDVYAGQQAALISATIGAANPETHGVRRTISSDTSSQFSGNEIRVSLYAKRPADNASGEFAVAYCVAGVYGQWVRFTPNDEYTFHEIIVDVPADTASLTHELVIWGDTAGGGAGVLVDRVLVTFAETDIPEVTAAIEQIQQALADQEQAVASQLQAFLSQLGQNTAAIQSEIETRSTQYGALASSLQILTAQTQDNAADIAADRAAWTSEVEAVAEDMLDLWAGVGGNEARITDEARVRATEDDLLAAVQRVMSASRGTAAATFYGLEEVRLADSEATALRIDGVEVQLADALAAIEQEQNVRASEYQALATQITTAVAELDGGISTVQQALSTEVTRLDGRVDAQSQALTTVQSQLLGDIATVQQSLNTNVNRLDGAVSANAQAIIDVQSATDDALAGVQQDFNTEVSFLKNEQDVAAAAYQANAQAITAVQAGYEGNLSTVQQSFNTQVARLDGRIDSAAQSLTGVQSQLSGAISTVQQNLNTNVSRIDAAVTANAQAITDIQSITGDSLAGVQQNFNTQVARLDGRIDTAAQAITEVRADMEEGVAGALTAVDAAVSGNDLLKNGLFSTGDLTGWEPDWADIGIVARDANGSSSAVRSMPAPFAASFPDSQWNANRRLRSAPQPVSAGDVYTIRFSFATGGASPRNIPFNLFVGYRSGPGAWSYSSLASFSASSLDWERSAPFSVTIPEGVTEARISISRQQGGSGTLLVTNLRAYRIDDAMAQSISTVQSELAGEISTVQQNLNTSVSRIDGAINANAQAIIDVQSATDGALAGVQQDFNTQVTRLDGRIDTAAQAVIEVRSDLEEDVAGVQQNLNTNVSRINGELQNNAQAITTVQSQLSGQISTVQQSLDSQINRVDGEIEATAQLVQRVQTDLGSGLQAVEVKAVTNAGGLLSNGQFATGDLAGWGDTWSGVSVIEANLDGSSGAIQSAPTRYIARWSDSAWSNHQYMRGERFTAVAGEMYTFQFAYASGGSNRNITIELRIAWVQADGATSYQTLRSQSVSSTSWNKTPLLSTVAPAGAVEAWVYFRRVSGGSGTLFLADVQARRTDMVAGALYTAKVQSGGLVGGFGIFNDGTEVEAGFDVDRFWIGRTDSDKRKPFIIDGNVVYMNNAMIRNGSIQEGQLGPITIGKFFLNDGTPVTTAGGLIRADAIDVDNLSVAEAARFYADVQSGNYIAGQSGWRIRQNGTVEFNQGQFNGSVNVGSVAGLGSLATQNSVSYASVTGGKPPVNADRTADNVAADTANVAGTAAATVRDRANAGNSANNRVSSWTRPSSTLIDGNQIFTGDAYVDTLQIKGQAVTIPVSVAAASAIAVGQPLQEREILWSSINAENTNVMVMVSFGVSAGAIDRFEIRRNGTTVIARPGGTGAMSVAAHVGADSLQTSIFTVHCFGANFTVTGRSIGLLATRR